MSPVERLYEAYHAGDAAAAAALYVPDGWHREVATSRTSRGRDAIRAGLTSFLAAFPDARWTVETRIAEGGRTAVAYRLTGTLSGPLGGLTPRGQRLDLRGVHVITSDERRIVSVEDYWDAGTFGAQMRAA
jgi:steroid delta-isomerase-like uncharacterized protein